MREQLHRFLRHCPPWMHDLYQSTAGVWRRFTALGPHYQRMLRGLDASQWWSADRIREFQDARICELVGHAYRSVPFYRERMKAAGVEPGDIRTQDDLAALPLLDKQTVRDQQERMVSRCHSRWALQRHGTSGTTGTAVVVYQTFGSAVLQMATWGRPRLRYGYRMTSDWLLGFTPRLTLMDGRTRPPFWCRDWFVRVAFISPGHIAPQFLGEMFKWISSRNFKGFAGWPSAMRPLADYMLDNGLRFERPPRFVNATAEGVSADTAARLSKAFECPVFSLYDMTEFAGSMFQCEAGRMHLAFEVCAVQMQEVKGGEGLQRLIFTGWGNPAMPFIRYDVGDLARPADGPCACGRASRSFLGLEGRADDCLRTADGRLVFGLAAHLPSAREVQIVQRKSGEIEVLVVAGADYDPADEVEMIRRFRERMGADLVVQVRRVDHIPRGPMGKFRAIVCEI